jgi:peptidoglycan/LPS O-acetylase OafA/YrhL
MASHQGGTPQASWGPPDGGWPALDGLRGVAILMVIAVHYLGTHHALHPDANFFFNLARAGWMGVDLFFALSGFLITGILLDTFGRPHAFRNFYVRRTLRIFPLYYLCLALTFGLAALIPALQTEGFRQIAEVQGWLWLYASNIKVAINQQWQTFGLFGGGWVEMSHLWSLAIEEQFYLLWPAALLLTPGRHRLRLTLAAFAMALLLRLFFLDRGNQIAAYALMPCRMDVLAAGACFAVVARRDGGTERALRWARPLAVTSALAIVALWIWRGVLWHGDPAVAGVGFSLIAVFSGCVVVFGVALPESHPLVRGLSARWLRSIGRVSYAMYLFHFALLKILFLRITPSERLVPILGSEAAVALLRFALVLVVTYAVARLSWRFYERPILALKRHFGAPVRN